MLGRWNCIIWTLAVCVAGCRSESIETPKPVDGVVISPQIEAVQMGTEARLQATAFSAKGEALVNRTFEWHSSNTAVATVSNSGVVTPISLGQTIISAICEGKSAELLVRVTPPAVETVAITPSNPVVTAGDSIQLTATLKDAQQNVLPYKPVKWSVTTTDGTTVSESGMVRTVVPGIARVVAEVDGVTGAANIRILSLPAASIDLQPAYQLLFPAGREDVWTAGHVFWTARDANGRYTGDAQVTLTSSEPRLAEVKPNGVTVGFAAAPRITITASSGNAVATATARVIAAVRITAGDYHMCFLSDLAEAYCWGRNVNGELGIGESDSVTTVPRKVLTEFPLDQISLGDAHSCALARSGDVYCWGANENGQLGDGSRTSRLTPVLVAGTKFRQVAAGTQETCAIAIDGDTYCWGKISTSTLSTVPKRMDFEKKFSSLSVGYGIQCGLDTDGFAYCWGANDQGQAGTGLPSQPLATPAQVTGAHRYSQIVVNDARVCALSIDGAAYCWGKGLAGASGSSSPTQLPQSSPFVAISMSRTSICGITPVDSAVCMGELPGDGSSDSGSSFVRAVSQYDFFPSDYSGVAVGYRSRCVITRPGMPMCWGLGAGNAWGAGTTKFPFVVHRP